MCEKITVTIGIPHHLSGQFNGVATIIKIALNRYDVLPYLSGKKDFSIQAFVDNKRLNKHVEDGIKAQLIYTFNHMSQKK